MRDTTGNVLRISGEVHDALRQHDAVEHDVEEGPNKGWAMAVGVGIGLVDINDRRTWKGSTDATEAGEDILGRAGRYQHTTVRRTTKVAHLIWRLHVPPSREPGQRIHAHRLTPQCSSASEIMRAVRW